MLEIEGIIRTMLLITIARIQTNTKTIFGHRTMWMITKLMKMVTYRTLAILFMGLMEPNTVVYASMVIVCVTRTLAKKKLDMKGNMG